VIDSKSVIKGDYRKGNILCVSDMHVPYQHPDALDFLDALKKKYKPALTVNLGDLLDFHGISFHDSDPDLESAGGELKKARKVIRDLEAIFPKQYIIGSNHGDLPVRKFIANGLPRDLLRTYNDIYAVGEGWTFVPDLTIETDSKHLPDIYFVHGIKVDALAVARQRGQRVVQGHYHEQFRIQYAGNPNTLLWGVNSGCLIDPVSLAFSYNKLNLNRPLLGTSVIVAGIPRLEPMILKKGGRWIGRLV
jgi:hypothetical protein